ncbi:MAG: histidine kinase [Actinomycetota bacterium]|nr:histidine kinase [Actinomycetota bacterium]
MRPGRSVLVNGVRLATALFVVLVGIVTYVVARGAGLNASYAGASEAAAVIMLTVGSALAAAGLAKSFGRPRFDAGDLCVLLGWAWVASPLVGWSEGPHSVRAAALVLSLFTVPLVLHLVVATLPRCGPRLRFAVVLSYASASAVGVVQTLFRDPYLDPTCYANCSVNPFMLHSFPDVVRVAELTNQWFVAGLGGLLIGVGAMRLHSGSRATRRRFAPIALPAILVGVVVVVRAMIGLARPVEDPFDDVLFAGYLATAASLLILAAGLMVAVRSRAARRRALTRFVTVLADVPPVGALEAALARSVDDPDLRLGYRLAGTGGLVDAGGRHLPEPRPGPGRHMTTLTRDGRPIAIVDHEGPVADIEEQLTASIRLALDNERLQAQQLATLEELRASRERLVEAGDLERRRLERDLHDGAQQRLLALSYDVRVGGAVAVAEGDTVTASTLARATEVTQDALRDLRELARGLFPAVLTDVGLAGALRTFADLAALPVDMNVTVASDRFPAPIESAAYFAVLEAVDGAQARQATQIHVTVQQERHLLVVEVKDDGREGALVPTVVADRVGALGGTVTAGPGRCRMEIPCG